MTLLAIIRRDLGKTKLTRAVIARWREAHPAYGSWPLGTWFHTGSSLAVRGPSRLERASRAWAAGGNGPPTGAAFAKYLDEYCDEFCEEFYD